MELCNSVSKAPRGLPAKRHKAVGGCPLTPYVGTEYM